MSKLRMTRNDYHKYLQKCVLRAYDPNDEYTFSDYAKEDIEIIPLDLSAYPQIKEDTAKYINAVFDKEDTDKNGNYMLSGFIGDSLEKWYRDKEKLHCNYAPYGFYYSGFGFNDEEMLIYTWCEGDTTLTLFNDRETYQKEREVTEKWFDENS
ncbi:hypothetical protein FMM80_00595 [Schaedlerella arabinosiphila]|uniref:Uncharacterized protein n=1 Tax=Schaedlerella arabinosiphila TaxID=2044587 RepID=A0A9X5H3J7_9FIRM|nr:hypothetical protein [Schaedlerella arabinosiphila]KAI4438916.1 hypothetical protein C824_001396 [Schaedlerella arabinosiphila]NDO67312.1 hypothetical protein [Schaedlerella arabinosiphila]